MLLKYSQYQKRSKLGANGKPHRGSVTGSRIPNKGKGYRKGKIVCSKRLNGHKTYATKREEEVTPVITVDPTCDNSNDSGLGFDQVDYQPHTNSFNNHLQFWNEDGRGIKRPRVDIKLESDNANDNFTFPQIVTVHQPQRPFAEKSRKTEIVKGKIGGGKVSSGKNGGKAGGRSIGKRGCNDANVATAKSRDGTVCLEILSQPENQHRARYQTEGSRGAVKDTSGNSFPLVKLSGYGASEPAILQVYIGTDQGKVAPHMFYQACKVSGKNSTPCVEKKLDGTVVIEIEFDATKDNLVLCDCVGILKERNVDVEHRFPDEATARSRKKSTRCRMVFRTTITLPTGQTETLQVTSHPIACTQPPGVPEISKKSLSSCPVTGNTELFIIGKNFLKDTKVKFYEGEPSTPEYWEHTVQPDKEFLHQSHLICTVPRYPHEDIKKAVTVNVCVVSGGKSSDPVIFLYTPVGTFPSQHMAMLTTPTVSASPPTTSSFFAVTQNMGTTSQTILHAVPETTTFTSPQKILIIPQSMNLSTPSVSSPPLSTNEKGLLKGDDVWIKEEINVVQELSQAAGVVQGLTQPSNVVHGLARPPSVVQGIPQTVQALTKSQNVIDNLTKSTNVVTGLSQKSTLVHALPQASTVVSRLSQTTNVAQGLAPTSNVVKSITRPTLVQPTSTQDNILLGATSVSGIVTNSSPVSSPTLLQDNNVPQSSNLLSVNQPPLLQVSDMVHPCAVLESTSSPVDESSPVMHSPELSPVALPTSPVLQSTSLKSASSPLQNNLTESPVIDSLSQASSSMVHNVNMGTSLIQSQSVTNSDLMVQSPPSMVTPGNLVPNLNHSHLISPTLNSTTNLVQSPPRLVKSPTLVLSPNMVHSQSPTSEIPSPNALIHPANVLETSNMNTASLLPGASLSNSPTMLPPVGTIAEAANVIQNSTMIEANNIAQANNLVGNTDLIGSGINNTIGNTNLAESTNILRDRGSCGTSVARGLESATPGGAASAVADLSSGQLPSMATIEKFVTATPLPALSVETYLSHIENKPKDNLVPSFPNPTNSETAPITMKQMVAVLEPKSNDATISFPGKIMNNLNRDSIHHSPMLLTSTENTTSHISYSNPDFLPSQPTDFQLLPRPETSTPSFSTTQFSTGQIFPPAQLYQNTPAPQEKPKPTPSPASNTKKCEEGIPVPHELTVMSENDLISYINPSCFDQV